MPRKYMKRNEVFELVDEIGHAIATGMTISRNIDSSIHVLPQDLEDALDSYLRRTSENLLLAIDSIKVDTASRDLVEAKINNVFSDAALQLRLKIKSAIGRES